VKLGFGPEHAQELIRMALDEDLHRADSDSLDVWAPIHASSTGNLPKPRHPLPRNAVAAKNPESPLLPSVRILS